MICLNNNKFFKKLFLIIFIFCLNGCDANKDGYNISLINSNGWIAIQESSLILISFLMMLCIVVPVIFMTIYFSIKYRANNINQSYDPDWSDSRKIEIAVWTIPIIIISILAFFSYNYTYKLDPKKSIKSFYKPIKINVVSLDWKWLFIYPEYQIATINEIMFPVNRPIVFEITSNSVMNSFFIPSLGSQIYAMPGMITKLNLIANHVGKYKGISSNYSGKGFSNMKFTAISVENNFIFKRWINKIKHSSNKLSTKKNFNIISVPNENYSVKYFSHVNKNLFHQIVNKNLIKNFSISKEHSKHFIKNTNMEK